MKTKKCNKCKIEKPLKEFSKDAHGKGGLRYTCKQCDKIKRRKYYNENQNKCREYAMRSYYKFKKENPEKYKIKMRESAWKEQGINCNNELYNKMFNKQSGYCAVCGKHQSELKRRFDVDHNHITNNIRGLLCNSCNAAIGSLGADSGIELLLKAIDYIRKTDNI